MQLHELALKVYPHTERDEEWMQEKHRETRNGALVKRLTNAQKRGYKAIKIDIQTMLELTKAGI